ncbi:MAG: pro-sigmaK processing inhibitor BofA family protein [Candidatus Micrarchaeia archaeon]
MEIISLLFTILFFLIIVAFVFLLTKSILKIFFVLFANTIAGLVAVFVLDFFGIKIALNLATLIAIALFGLPAVGTLLLLKIIP